MRSEGMGKYRMFDLAARRNSLPERTVRLTYSSLPDRRSIVDPDVLEFAQVMAILIPSIAAMAAIGLVTFRVVQRSKPTSAADSRSSIGDERLERLEQAVDAIAIEVERISESQRFTTKLLAERASVSTQQSVDRIG